MSRHRVAPASALLCERCGYDLRDALGALCPECGRDVASSLPGARPGTPFQRNPNAITLIATGWATLRHPVRTYDIARVDPDDRGLIWAQSTIAGVLLAIAWPLVQHQIVPAGFPVVDVLIAAPVAILIIRVLTWIEQRGTRFFGRRRGYRITPAIARAVCAHAGVGWVVAGALTLLGGALGIVIESALRNASLGVLRPIVILSPQWMPIAGGLLGMLVFESLSALGMTRMRYVNEGESGSSGNREIGRSGDRKGGRSGAGGHGNGREEMNRPGAIDPP